MMKAVVSRGEIVRSSRYRPIGKKASLCESKRRTATTRRWRKSTAILLSWWSPCAASEPANEDQLERALREVRCQAKEQVRRQMGLA